MRGPIIRADPDKGGSVQGHGLILTLESRNRICSEPDSQETRQTRHGRQRNEFCSRIGIEALLCHHPRVRRPETTNERGGAQPWLHQRGQIGCLIEKRKWSGRKGDDLNRFCSGVAFDRMQLTAWPILHSFAGSHTDLQETRSRREPTLPPPVTRRA